MQGCRLLEKAHSAVLVALGSPGGDGRCRRHLCPQVSMTSGTGRMWAVFQGWAVQPRNQVSLGTKGDWFMLEKTEYRKARSKGSGAVHPVQSPNPARQPETPRWEPGACRL